MLLLIDNYDSFTYNIVHYLGEIGEDIIVKKNDAITLAEIETMAPEFIVIGPGPCAPENAGISIPIIKHFAGNIPILGICLGHQCIASAFGGKIIRAKTPMHGKISTVSHQQKYMFNHLPNPVNCTRYHSLVIDQKTFPDCLEITATSDDNEIMGIHHRTFAIEGIQFHPEGLLTQRGHDMLKNFLMQHRSTNSLVAD